MMGDRSLGKAQEEVRIGEAISGGDFEAGALEFFVRAAHGLAIGPRVAQCGVADARELVCERTGRLVVVGACLYAEGPMTKRVEVLSGGDCAGGSMQFLLDALRSPLRAMHRAPKPQR